ncbi:MAG: hypothetical protein E7647_03965 [Ruminococcaceae bacterium]|nr:hypothetical protein [Oscillospiraceae bacterium]
MVTGSVAGGSVAGGSVTGGSVTGGSVTGGSDTGFVTGFVSGGAAFVVSGVGAFASVSAFASGGSVTFFGGSFLSRGLPVVSSAFCVSFF